MMFKRIILAVVVIASFAVVAGTSKEADAWRRRVWRRPVVVAPRAVRRPVVAPRRYGVGYRPYWGARYYRGYIGPRVYVGW